MPVALQAGLWGLLAGGALVLGAAIAWFVDVPPRLIAGVMAFGAVSAVAVAAIFLSNVPEGLSSAAGMRRAGRSAAYVFGVWGGIALVSGVSAWAGYVLFDGVSAGMVAAVTAVAAGAILAMLADTMIPEAFEVTRDAAGLITVLGFLAAFVLSKLGG